MSDKTVCPQCGNSYKQVLSHWVASSQCNYPNTPKAIMEMAHGVLAISGRINERVVGKKNNITVDEKDTEENIKRHKKLSQALGLYSSSVGLNEQEKEAKIVGEDYTRTYIRHHLKPIPELQTTPNFNQYTPSFLFIKTLLHLEADIGPERIQIIANKSRTNADGLLTDLFENRNEYRVSEETNAHRITYTSPTEEFRPILDIEWPTGWWNDMLRCENPLER